MHIRRLRFRSFLTLRRVIIYSLLVLGIAAGSIVFQHYAQSAEREIASIQQLSDDQAKTMDAIIVATLERKAEEERLRKEALAKETAEKVITTPEASAGTIDATGCNVSGTRNDPNSIDVLVNKKHCIQPLTFVPGDLVTVYGATISAKAADNFRAMFEAAQAAGQPLSVTSSYRSYSNQVSTYNYWVSISGAAGADTYSARPGYSEHQTGLAIDFASGDGSCVLDCFGTTSQYQWLQANAAQYGFIQRYYAGSEAISGYKAEEWHYRYVGVQTAQALQASSVNTLEEFWGLPGGVY